MAAANWVCIALLLSLCLRMCSGNRVGLPTIDKDAKELVNLNQDNKIGDSKQEVGSSSSSTGPGTGDKDFSDFPVGSTCQEIDNDHSGYNDVIGGCDRGHGIECRQAACSVGALAQKALQLTKKLYGNCYKPMNGAMAPESG